MKIILFAASRIYRYHVHVYFVYQCCIKIQNDSGQPLWMLKKMSPKNDQEKIFL